MNGSLVSALTLPKLPVEGRRATGLGSRRLAMPSLPDRPTRTVTYDLAAIDQWGRVIARTAMRAVGWQSRTRISYRVIGGMILVVSDEVGAFAVSDQGHLRLPFPLRQWHGLDAGTRLLVVGESQGQRLVIHFPGALDEMIARTHADALGGGLA